MALKLFKPYMSWRAGVYALKTMYSGSIAEGPIVKKFEYEFGKKFNKRNVVALNSGTSALELAYELAEIKSGDEVITPILTCTATNIPLVRKKAKIVFADIDHDLNISIEDVKRKITEKTKAIVFVHFGGNSRGLKELEDICSTRGIKLIEDAAHSIGSSYWGRGDFTCVSLQAIKTLTAGDGGFLICKSKEDYQKAKRLRWFGYDRDLKHKLGDTDIEEAGYKYHMNDITAAIGLGNLRSLNRVLSHRKRLAEIYKSYGLFAYSWLAGGFTNNLEGLKSIYADHGVEIGQHHYRNDKYTLFRKFKTYCSAMDSLEKSYFFVPFHFGVTESQAHQIGALYEFHRA